MYKYLCCMVDIAYMYMCIYVLLSLSIFFFSSIASYILFCCFSECTYLYVNTLRLCWLMLNKVKHTKKNLNKYVFSIIYFSYCFYIINCTSFPFNRLNFPIFPYNKENGRKKNKSTTPKNKM